MNTKKNFKQIDYKNCFKKNIIGDFSVILLRELNAITAVP